MDPEIVNQKIRTCGALVLVFAKSLQIKEKWNWITYWFFAAIKPRLKVNPELIGSSLLACYHLNAWVTRRFFTGNRKFMARSVLALKLELFYYHICIKMFSKLKDKNKLSLFNLN